MELAITLHKDELVRALTEFLPMRLVLGARDAQGGPAEEDPPWIEVEAFDTLTFMPGIGVAITCAAHVHYPLPILSDDFTIQTVSLEVIPKLVDGPNGAIIAFAIDVAEIDIKNLPEFVDRAVAKRINATLSENLHTLAWDFSRTLTRIIHLPRRLERVRAIELAGPRGTLSMTDTELVLRVDVELHMHHEEEGE